MKLRLAVLPLALAIALFGCSQQDQRAATVGSDDAMAEPEHGDGDGAADDDHHGDGRTDRDHFSKPDEVYAFLGIGVGDRIAMFEHSYYSVISPEGCAGILWKSHAHAEEAANALRFTSKDLSRLNIVDNIIAEPLGGAHRDHHRTAAQLKLFLVKTLRELSQVPTDELVQQRYEKFRHMGVFFEGSSLTAPDSFNVAGQVSTDE